MVTIDGRERIAVPAELLAQFGLEPGDALVVEVEDNGFALRMAKAINPLDSLAAMAGHEHRAGRTKDLRSVANGEGINLANEAAIGTDAAKSDHIAERTVTSKYDALSAYLSNLPGQTCELRFSEIEALLGAPLPPAARRHTAWWKGSAAGSPSHVQKMFGWHAAGWVVEELDIHGERVTFRRAEPSDAVSGADPSA